MTSPTPLLVVPALIWTLIAAVSVITAIVNSVRARQKTSPAWNPFATPFPAAVAVAALAYAAAALAADRFSFSAAAFSALWPAMAASALRYTVAGRISRWPNWADYVFAAVGALLYGALPY
ncbi:hypothetical protein [Streptomyces herbicida]|uniref:hypothetical protein n=1 Tax=Streptomyces herbicida TaxID=3065675 RepID=UPI00292E1232|nr:hypothetical protein [Streptomyces sp. NEAU-HV9]